MSTYRKDQPTEISKLKEVKLSDQAARDWLRENYPLVNKKWKSVRLEWYPSSTEQVRDKDGNASKVVLPPNYWLSYYRSRFRLFGQEERALMRFYEDDICAVSFRRCTNWCFWDASYELDITLVNAWIRLSYLPPFFGVTPIASARHSEDVEVAIHLGRPKLGSR